MMVMSAMMLTMTNGSYCMQQRQYIVSQKIMWCRVFAITLSIVNQFWKQQLIIYKTNIDIFRCLLKTYGVKHKSFEMLNCSTTP